MCPHTLKSTAKTALLLIIITAASKLAGFLRESLIAANYGATAHTDAYIIAVTIFTSVSLISSEVINSAFLPVYVRASLKDNDRADRFAGSAAGILVLASIVLVLAGELFAGVAVKLYAPAFTGEIYRLAVRLVRITLPVIVVTVMSILAGGILQSKECFLPRASMGMPNHLIVILFLVLAGNSHGVLGLTIATAAGTASQLMLMLPFLKRTGFKLRPGIDLRMPEVKLFFASLIPVFIGSSARQVNTLIDRALASGRGYGGISVLNYANVVNISLIGLFVLTVTAIVYPKIARASNKEDRDFSQAVSKGINTVLILVIPVSIIVWFYSYEITTILFQRGKFSIEDAKQASQVLFYYSLGLIPIGVTDVLTKAFYTKGLRKIPVKTGLLSVAVNILLNIVLIDILGIKGLALSTSIAAALAMILLFYPAQKRMNIASAKSLKSTAHFLAAAISMAAVLILSRAILPRLITVSTRTDMLISLIISSLLGLLAYILVIHSKIKAIIAF